MNRGLGDVGLGLGGLGNGGLGNKGLGNGGLVMVGWVMVGWLGDFHKNFGGIRWYNLRVCALGFIEALWSS